ncbi:MAG: PQQ-binding-like beta-propeller repeat protein [Bacteroidota bacterium]
MTNLNKPSERNIRLLHSIAFAAGLMAFVLCILISVNYYQVKRTNPLNSPTMKTLIERFRDHPEDEQISNEIREFDLLARKAFFTNQWQIRTGAYLLLFNILLLIVCLKSIELLSPKIPDVPGATNESFWNSRKINRRWVAWSGTILVCFSLIFAYLTHQELGSTILQFSKSERSKQDSSGQVVEKTESETVVSDSKAKAPSKTIEGYPSQEAINSNSACFRGPGSNGIVFQRGLPVSWDGRSGKNIKWKTQIPLTGYNSPIVWGDKIFLSGANPSKREVYCFDLNSGKILWTKLIEKIPGTSATVPKVNIETGLAAPSLTTDGTRVYAIFANGDLVALDFEGKQVWAKNLGLPKNHYGHSSSLLMFQDKLLVQYDQSDGANFIALSGKTGEIAWKTKRDVRISWSSPIVVSTGNQMEAILVAEPFVISYNPATGKELWRINCISGEVGPSLAYANGIVFSVNEYSKLSAVKIGATPSILWESDEYMSDIPSPVATEKYLFLPTSYGTMVCYDAKTGNKYWEHDFATPTYASPMLVDGNIYQLDKKGVMHVFKADKAYHSIKESSLGEGSVCTPAFIDGKIIIRGDKNLYCIGK